MLERKIELKRNSFFVFTLRFLPIIFWGGMIAIWAYNAFSSDVAKMISCLFFVIAIFFGVKDLINNKNWISFTDAGISVCVCKKGKMIVKKFLPVQDIMYVKCDERFKNVYITMKDSSRYELLKYNSAHMLGADKFFFVKSELCRFFPNIAHEYIDDEVKAYIETAVISEFLKNKVEMARCQAGMLVFAELVFSAIPLGLSILAFVWVVVRIIYYLLLGAIFVLDKIKI